MHASVSRKNSGFSIRTVRKTSHLIFPACSTGYEHRPEKDTMKTAISSLVLLLMTMSHPLHADSRTNYFDRAESQRFGTEAERRNETTNWLDDAPVIQIQQFDLSALSEQIGRASCREGATYPGSVYQETEEAV